MNHTCILYMYTSIKEKCRQMKFKVIVIRYIPDIKQFIDFIEKNKICFIKITHLEKTRIPFYVIGFIL